MGSKGSVKAKEAEVGKGGMREEKVVKPTEIHAARVEEAGGGWE